MNIYEKFNEYFYINDRDLSLARKFGTLPSPGIAIPSHETVNQINEVMAITNGLGYGICLLFEKCGMVIPWLLSDDEKELTETYNKLKKTDKMLSLVLDYQNPNNSFFTNFDFKSETFIPNKNSDECDFSLTNKMLKNRKSLLNILCPGDHKYDDDYLYDDIGELYYQKVLEGVITIDPDRGFVLTNNTGNIEDWNMVDWDMGDWE